MDGHIQQVVILVLDGEVFTLDPIQGGFVQSDKLSDAVIHMYHPVAGLEVAVDHFRAFGGDEGPAAGLRAAPAKDL